MFRKYYQNYKFYLRSILETNVPVHKQAHPVRQRYKTPTEQGGRLSANDREKQIETKCLTKYRFRVSIKHPTNRHKGFHFKGDTLITWCQKRTDL